MKRNEERNIIPIEKWDMKCETFEKKKWEKKKKMQSKCTSTEMRVISLSFKHDSG